MSWASRRRFAYLTGVIVFFAVIIIVPTIFILYEPASCFDGELNQGETAPDRGGPCKLLDERSLIPHAILWARGFPIRDGAFSGVAYLENPNGQAGVVNAPYRFQLYDSRNILVAEHEGLTYLMPGAITPIYVGSIDTGEREVTRAFFEFMAPLVWERYTDRSKDIGIRNKILVGESTAPRLSAVVRNNSPADMRDVEFVGVIFDVAGNAFAASRTVVPLLEGGAEETVVFTWPEPFLRAPARTDVLPSIAPID